ncbi:MAG: HAD-IIIA family hydrolase [Planctomycetota bacterium]
MTIVSRPDRELSLPIRCILSDVDGVLTDGTLDYDSQGSESKQFHVRDGLGIKRWIQSGKHFGIITARKSEMVTRRASELGITMLAQNASDKLSVAAEMVSKLGVELSSVCYIGDDLPDLPVMRNVGLAATPADGANDAKETAHWVLETVGGRGAVRELIERLMRATDTWQSMDERGGSAGK